MSTAAVRSTPMAAASSGRAKVSATWISALDGMQPTFRQTPPTRSRSTRVTVRPAAAARRAAEYPPGPPPMTSRSTPVATSPTTISPSPEAGGGRWAEALLAGPEQLGQEGDRVGEEAGDVLGEGGGQVAVDQAVVG